jgi:hypothetical protein
MLKECMLNRKHNGLIRRRLVSSSQFQGIEFAKIDVDDQAETTSRAGVRVRNQL